MTNICVFCGASPGTQSAFLEEAGRLGEQLAHAGFDLVYGAGGAGMMGAVSDGVLRGGGHVTGIIPKALMDREFGRTDISDLIVVSDMHERKSMMYRMSSAFVTLPGGFGTMEEFFETITWTQLGLHTKPSFVLNIGEYYTPLQNLLDHALASEFITGADRQLVIFIDDVVELVEQLTNLYQPHDDPHR